ncbi:hypothetical protein [Yersinia kristensenii]|uniref:hypothetical protein n=1 Tax=Yersinia kristensenii TaxID=28152 RepID=UPI000B07A9DC|nr:hypothetical protein [Yersinia kristensenii]
MLIVEQFKHDNFVGDHYHCLVAVLIDYSLGFIAIALSGDNMASLYDTHCVTK